MEIKGKIKKLFDTETFKSGFKKQELVITTQEQYPQDITIQFLQDKILLLNDFKEGDEVTISFNLLGKKWVNPQGETKYFNSLDGWRIKMVDTKNPNIPPAPKEEVDISYNFNDLPF